MKSPIALFLLFLALALPGAAQQVCAYGQGRTTRDVGRGFALHILPTVDKCRALVVGPDGKEVFDALGVTASLHAVPEQDINQDGSPDMVVVTRRERDTPLTYAIVSLGEPPGLLRQFDSYREVEFEDRDGDGKIEIITRDTAFANFDGLPDSLSPLPLVFFRMRGQNLVSVSHLPAFWAEYEREIAMAKGRLPKEGLRLFSGYGQRADDQEKPKPEDAYIVLETKGLVLEVALDYLYGGKGQEAWHTISEWWPGNDRARIRQQILKTRMSGILGEVAKPAPALAAKPASQ